MFCMNRKLLVVKEPIKLWQWNLHNLFQTKIQTSPNTPQITTAKEIPVITALFQESTTLVPSLRYMKKYQRVRKNNTEAKKDAIRIEPKKVSIKKEMLIIQNAESMDGNVVYEILTAATFSRFFKVGIQK